LSAAKSPASYWAGRLLQSLWVLWGVSTLVFLVLRLVPGDPVESILGEQALAVDKENLRKCLGLDKSLWEQYAGFLAEVGSGSFGELCDQPGVLVRERLWAVFPATAELALVSLLIAAALALPLGVVAALRRGTWVDGGAAVVSLLGLSIPNFWLGPMLLLGLSLLLKALPGDVGPLERVSGLWLPALTLGTALAARLSRMTRASVLDVLHQDFVRTARAKGLAGRVVIVKHVLRNALIPVVTLMGLQLGALLGGAIIVEKVFARPGLGSLLLEAIEMRNYRLVQGCVLVIALSYVVVNLLTDVLYARLDPRVELSE
jgi:peptide/nickel transport system permease protein